MAKYTLNEVDILMTLDECNRNYKRTSHHYAELYPNRYYPSVRQMINIERKVCRNTLHDQRQINGLLNNNDPRLLTVWA